MARLLEQYPLSVEYRQRNLLEDLVGTIISQQLSVKAADTIYGRFLEIFGGKFPAPEAILSLEDEVLRARGLSGAKTRYLKSLVEAVKSGQLRLERLPQMEDEAVIQELTKLPGIGPWSAQMTLIFSLHRPDVFSLGDLGLRTAVARHYEIDRDDLERVEEISRSWSPWRSYASRLLWSSLDNAPKQS
jgi:DNA-3-methyladenine glycosylase II